MKAQQQTTPTKEKLPHVSTYGRYNGIRGILDRKRQGIDCNEDESRAIKVWVKYETLAVGNGSIELDTEIQELLPIEWGEAQDELGNCDENGKIKEMGLIKLYTPTPTKEGLHTQGEWYVNNPHDDNGEIIIKTNPDYGNQKYFAIGIKSEYNFVGFYYPNSKQSDTEMIANAKIICQAVNERQALLDSHRELKLAAHNALMTLQALRDIDKSIAPQTIKELETAINNAKNIQQSGLTE